MAKRIESPPERAQTRLRFDEEMGELWDWYCRIPERYRAREVLHLVVVGFATMRGLARGSTVNEEAGIPTRSSTTDSVKLDSATGIKGGEPQEGKKADGELASLAGWGSTDDPNFETSDAVVAV